MRVALEILFWSSALALLYTYIGYPMIIGLLGVLRPRPHRRAACEPTVTVVITAYNEERDLAAKLENTLALDYDPAKLDVIVASDSSTDRTDEIARSFIARGVHLLRQNERQGKTAAQNAAVTQASGEIILFSDATTLYRPDVLRALTPNFADPAVGCVAGCLIYVDPTRSGTGRGARSYWSYETFLRRNESRISSLVGAPGCLYAVRREAYVPLYHEACSDFIIATKMVEQGLRAVYEPEAVCEEETNRRAGRELRMRVRIIAQTLTDLWRHRALLNPVRGGFFSVQLLSHKVLRYLVPFFLMIIFLTSVGLAMQSVFFAILFGAQVLFYLAALFGWLFEQRGLTLGPFVLPAYFVLANLAAVIAFYQFLRGERYARWEPIREGTDLSAPAQMQAIQGSSKPEAVVIATQPSGSSRTRTT
jgi:cellulose synthase/poly-beta-1,6-N-acetylglucosamine synthase-like glycosyltransferase